MDKLSLAFSFEFFVTSFLLLFFVLTCFLIFVRRRFVGGVRVYVYSRRVAAMSVCTAFAVVQFVVLQTDTNVYANYI